MIALLRSTFADWKKGDVPELKIADARDPGGPSIVRFVNKDTSQTHLRIGHLTIREDDPDYVALAIANDILGGSSFRSRLFNDVRTKRGLAYSVGSRLNVGMHDQGVWLMRAETKLPSTQEVISRFVANMERMRTELVTDEELAEAKEAYVNSFVFSFASPSAIVGRFVELEYDGLPKDFLQQLRARVMALTKEDILSGGPKTFPLKPSHDCGGRPRRNSAEAAVGFRRSEGNKVGSRGLKKRDLSPPRESVRPHPARCGDPPAAFRLPNRRHPLYNQSIGRLRGDGVSLGMKAQHAVGR